ncbi:MAG: autotransporter domain-containing protein [Rhizobiaceae bacterium]
MRSQTIRTMAAGLAAGVAMTVAAWPAMAQQHFDRLISFGDSYADPLINLIPILGGNLDLLPSQGRSVEDVAASSPWVAFPYWLQDGLGLANEDMTSYAIAGSTTDQMNETGVPYSLPFQLERSAGEVYGPNDLVTLSIGGNDGRRDSRTYGADFSPELAERLGGGVAGRASNAVKTFVGQGAGTVLAVSFSDLSILPELAAHPRPDGLAAYGAALYNGMQTNLVDTAEAGGRIFLFDLSLLGAQLKANPQLYGFKTFLFEGNEATSVFGPDSLHLTSNGFQVAAAYMLNVLQSPYAAALAPELAEASSESFTTSLFGRLDSRRFETTTTPYSIYLMGGLAGASGDVGGDGGRGTLGAETWLSPDLMLGAAASYSSLSGDNSLVEIDDQALQVAAYGSWKHGNWFADALLGYGNHELELVRPGVVLPVVGETDADTVNAALRGGYLFDLGGVRAGPVLGLHHTRTRVDAYQDSGDPSLAILVDRQKLSSTTSEVGAQVHAALSERVQGFAGIAWHHEFGDEARVLTTRLAQSPLLPINTTIQNFDSQDYGVVSAGLSFDVSENLNATLAGAATFARGDADSFQIDAGLSLRF